MFRKNNIQTIDFGALYRDQKQRSNSSVKTAKDWDKKAVNMANNFGGIYPNSLINSIDFIDAKTMLDLGSGAGTIAIAISDKFEKIYAVDFSQVTLDNLMRNCEAKNVKNITPIKADIEGDFANVPYADIAIASRSLEVSDIEKTLVNINKRAKMRVYLTYKVGGSFLHAPILQAIGRVVTPKPDYIYILNILYNMGIYAELKFIQSEGKGFHYQNETDYIKNVEQNIGELSEIEKEKLARYFDKVKDDKEERDPPLTWALISYNTQTKERKWTRTMR
ncbi:MAG: class I SAM-dependent methyltransferase [Helicobacteraceae bacterium]|jgi:ubiquinone/menaquinone biosynthesis C-methylase UbiE|nr:class I SAM-dependent methyltransferase [Helicobacteraceae bacterium]